jgi:peptidylprolyl isomerase domain and WD repeat-containing protein 1
VPHQYNDVFDTVVSIDTKGMMEYWVPPIDTGSAVASEALKARHSGITFAFKSETDLYEFAKKKTIPLSLTFSPNGKLFAIYSTDRQVRCCSLTDSLTH